jgi:hypothetical protein
MDRFKGGRSSLPNQVRAAGMRKTLSPVSSFGRGIDAGGWGRLPNFRASRAGYQTPTSVPATGSYVHNLSYKSIPMLNSVHDTSKKTVIGANHST